MAAVVDAVPDAKDCEVMNDCGETKDEVEEVDTTDQQGTEGKKKRRRKKKKNTGEMLVL